MHGRSQEFSKRGGGGHTVSNRGYSPEYNVSCCRSFVLKKGLRRGGGGGLRAPKDPLATPLDYGLRLDHG